MDSDTWKAHSGQFKHLFLPVKVDRDIRPAAGDLSKGERGNVTPGLQCPLQHMSDFL